MSRTDDTDCTHEALWSTSLSQAGSVRMGQNARTIAERSSFANVYAERHTTATDKARVGVFVDSKKNPISLHVGSHASSASTSGRAALGAKDDRYCVVVVGLHMLHLNPHSDVHGHATFLFDPEQSRGMEIQSWMRSGAEDEAAWQGAELGDLREQLEEQGELFLNDLCAWPHLTAAHVKIRRSSSGRADQALKCMPSNADHIAIASRARCFPFQGVRSSRHQLPWSRCDILASGHTGSGHGRPFGSNDSPRLPCHRCRAGGGSGIWLRSPVPGSRVPCCRRRAGSACGAARC